MQVVDGDHLDAILLFQAAGFGPEFHDVEARGFIDEDFGFLEFATGFGESFFLGVGEEAAGEVAEGEHGAGDEEATNEHCGAHFQGEDGAGGVEIDGDVLDDVHGERGFPHGRASGDDEHFTALQAGADFVELGVAGGEAAELTGVLQHVFDGVDGIVYVVLHVAEAFFGAAVFTDGEDALFGDVDDGVDVLVEFFTPEFVGGVDVDGAGVDEVPEDGLLFEDVPVVGVVGRDGDVDEEV